MAQAPRFEHRILPSGEHCVTSPDVRGLCAVADSEIEAREEAKVLLALLEERGLVRLHGEMPHRERA